jgi:hypothetical protein
MDLPPILESFQDYPIDPTYQELLHEALVYGAKILTVESLPESRAKDLYRSMGVAKDEIYFLDVRSTPGNPVKFKEIWFLGIQCSHVSKYPISYQADLDILINKLIKYLNMRS